MVCVFKGLCCLLLVFHLKVEKDIFRIMMFSLKCSLMLKRSTQPITCLKRLWWQDDIFDSNDGDDGERELVFD